MKYKAIYWFILSPFIKSYLNIHFSKSQTKEFTKKAKSFYKDLLAKADDIGEKNPMASNLYFALLLFSFFFPNKANISLDMFKDLMNYVLNHPFVLFFTKCDLNNDKTMNMINKKIKKAALWAEKNKDKYPQTWEFNFYDKPREGCAYYFTKCPIAKFFKDNHYEEYTELFCNLDYIKIAPSNGILIREHTIAQGYDICDFWIIGNKAKKE